MEIERCNEIDLIQQTLAGNSSAFNQLVKMHRNNNLRIGSLLYQEPGRCRRLDTTDIHSGIRAALHFTGVGLLSGVASTDCTQHLQGLVTAAK